MFDPMLNADYAARFLTELYANKGNWVDSVAAYHSQNPQNAEIYIEKVETVLTQLKDAGLPKGMPAPASQPIDRNNRFPLLLPGQRGTLASLVPRGQARSPFLTRGP